MQQHIPIHSRRLVAQGFHFALPQSLRHRHGLTAAWGSGALRTYTQPPWMEELTTLRFSSLFCLDVVIEKKALSKSRAWVDVVVVRTVCRP